MGHGADRTVLIRVVVRLLWIKIAPRFDSTHQNPYRLKKRRPWFA